MRKLLTDDLDLLWAFISVVGKRKSTIDAKITIAGMRFFMISDLRITRLFFDSLQSWNLNPPFESSLLRVVSLSSFIGKRRLVPSSKSLK